MADAARLSPIRVTRMEMTAPPQGAPLPAPDPAVTIIAMRLSVEDYLALYREVGEPQGWDLRYRLSREDLSRVLADPTTLLLVVREGEHSLGFIEFETRGGEAEVLHFGLIPEARGRKLGPWLLDAGLRAAWQCGVRRIHLHTDDWDHPRARDVYRRAGFVVVSDQLEDPTDL